MGWLYSVIGVGRLCVGKGQVFIVLFGHGVCMTSSDPVASAGNAWNLHDKAGQCEGEGTQAGRPNRVGRRGGAE